MTSPFKLTVHQWACNHELSIIAATYSHQAVFAAEKMHFISEKLRSREIDRRLPMLPPYEIWSKLYLDHQRFFEAVADQWPGVAGPSADIKGTSANLRIFNRMRKENPEEVAKEIRSELEQVPVRRINAWFRLNVREARKKYRRHLEVIAEDLTDRIDDKVVDDFEAAITSKVEMLFFLRVVLMCLAEYETLPIHLLRKAWHSDELSIERLLRLDDVMIHDPRIQRWITGSGGAQRVRRLQLAARWMSDGPNGKNPRLRFKQSMAGLISAMSEKMFFVWKGRTIVRQPLTARQIADLFDAAYRDKMGRREAVMVDPDISTINDESWAKAIQRLRPIWTKVLWPNEGGQKSLEVVSG